MLLEFKQTDRILVGMRRMMGVGRIHDGNMDGGRSQTEDLGLARAEDWR